MKKCWIVLLAVLLPVLGLAGCGEPATKTDFSDIDRISIFYAYESFSVQDPSADVIQTIVDQVNDASYVSSDAQMDLTTAFYISFWQGDTQVGDITFDQNGAVWLNSDQDVTYRVASGTLDYAYVQGIYQAAQQ